MLKYELRKLFSQRTVCLLLSAVYLVFVVTFTAEMRRIEEEVIPAEAVDNYFHVYMTDRESLEATMAERRAIIAEYNDKVMHMTIEEAEAYAPLELKSYYIDSDKFTDESLWSVLEQRLDYCSYYAANVNKVIHTAQMNLNEAESNRMPSDSYYYRYQTQMVDTYSKVLSRAPAIGFEHIHGWDSLFLSGTMNLFLMLTVLLFAVTIFSQERESGFIGVLRVSKYGRGKTAVNKFLSLILYIIAAVCIYIVTAMIIIAATVGFLSAVNYIQAIEEFLYAPYALTMIEYLLVFAGMKILSMVLYAMAVMLISQLVHSIELIYVGGVVLYGLSYLGMYLPEANILYHIGFASTLYGSAYMKQNRLLNLFGSPISYMAFTVGLYLILILLLAVVNYFVYCKGSVRGLRRLSLIGLKHKIKPNRLTAKSQKHISNGFSLFWFEGYKQLVSSRLIWLLIPLLAVQLLISGNNYNLSQSRSEEYYLEYLEQVKGEYSDEARIFIETEGAFISNSLAAEEEAGRAYLAGLISESEYAEIEQNYYYALFHYDAFHRLADQQDYILSQAEKGNEAWFISTRGWNQYFSSGVSYPMLIFLLLLACSTFAGEYKNDPNGGCFAVILRTSKKGRRETFFAKLFASMTAALAGTALFGAADLSVFAYNLGLSDLNAPLSSVEYFADMHSSLTIGGYLALYFATVLISALLLTVCVCALSEFTHRTLSTLCIATGILILPDILISVGIEAVEYLSILKGLDGHALWLWSAQANTESGVRSGILMLCGLLVFTIVLTVAAYRKYIGVRRNFNLHFEQKGK